MRGLGLDTRSCGSIYRSRGNKTYGRLLAVPHKLCVARMCLWDGGGYQVQPIVLLEPTPRHRLCWRRDRSARHQRFACRRDRDVLLHEPARNGAGNADAAGNVLSTVEYRPYGEQILGVPEAGPGYTGHINDPDSGLVYMQARYYDPVVGRFVAVDPAVSEPGDVLSASRYAYANSNPVKYVDPTGKVVRLANERQTLLELINARASGAFTVDRKGNLQSTGDSDDASKSSTYTNALRQAIESKSVITVSIKASYKDPATGARKSVDKDAGGGVTIGARSGGDQKVTISGNANNSLKDASGQPLRDQPADILVHELVGHAIPHIAGSDTGNAVQNENKVRGEVEEGGQRAEEPWHKE